MDCNQFQLTSLDSYPSSSASEPSHANDNKSTENELKPKMTHKDIWQDIINRRNEEYKNLNHYLLSKEPHDDTPPHPELYYLENTVLPVLQPILEKALFNAIKMECLKGQRNLYNGIDYIAETLWNTNERYPERIENPQNIFLMKWTSDYLRKHPRQIFPKSWIWSRETAALKIQAFMRGYFVRRQEDVQEMRQFWRILLQERRFKVRHESL